MLLHQNVPSPATACSNIALHSILQPAMDTKTAAKKYDRQLRIWGAHGQAALEKARICVLGSGCTATEALKNLVLGGIAGFTVVDDAIVQPSDLGNNFLLDASSLGRCRAAAVTELLLEMNESVAGSFAEDSPEALIGANPRFFADFQLVLATQVRYFAALLVTPVICTLTAGSGGHVTYMRPACR